MNLQQQYELIETYLEGGLTGTELSDFEHRLRADADFSKEVALHRELANALVEQDVLRLESLLAELRNEGPAAQHSVATKPKGGKRILLRPRNLAIAASIALALVAVFAVRNFLAPSTDLVAAFYEPYPDYLTDNTRNAETDQLLALEKGKKAYAENDFAAAMLHFKAVLKDSPNRLDVLFYIAICQMETGDLTNAENNFRHVADGDTIFAVHAQWYHALALLKLGRKAEAKTTLNTIVQERGDYAKKAAELLEAL